jgi:sortase B
MKYIKYFFGNLAFVTILIAVFTIVFVVMGNTVYIYFIYRQAETEYSQLREIAPERYILDGALLLANEDSNISRAYEDLDEDLIRILDERADGFDVGPLPEYEGYDDLDPEATDDLLEINPGYMGWIFMENTRIDYPVVRGVDNTMFMDHTFRGVRNRAGAIFMDFRCYEGFDTPLTVLYGHNSRNGSMFAGLHDVSVGDFVHIITPDGTTIPYRIYELRYTTVQDSAYTLIGKSEEVVIDFLYDELNARRGSTRLLLLSTCVHSHDPDDRLVVLAVQYPYE